MQKLRKEFKSEDFAQHSEPLDEVTSVELNHVFYIIFILGGGVILSFLLCVLELFWKYIWNTILMNRCFKKPTDSDASQTELTIQDDIRLKRPRSNFLLVRAANQESRP